MPQRICLQCKEPIVKGYFCSDCDKLSKTIRHCVNDRACEGKGWFYVVDDNDHQICSICWRAANNMVRCDHKDCNRFIKEGWGMGLRNGTCNQCHQADYRKWLADPKLKQRCATADCKRYIAFAETGIKGAICDLCIRIEKEIENATKDAAVDCDLTDTKGSAAAPPPTPVLPPAPLKVEDSKVVEVIPPLVKLSKSKKRALRRRTANAMKNAT